MILSSLFSGHFFNQNKKVNFAHLLYKVLVIRLFSMKFDRI